MRAREKTFSLHWGSGVVAEEAKVEGGYHFPTIQLLKYRTGQAAGEIAVRFCHYTPRGAFSRSPLIISAREIEELGTALKNTPELLDLLRRMVI